VSQALLEQLAAICGPGGVLTDTRDVAPYLTDWRGVFTGTALAVVRPADTAAVAASVRACADAGVAIVPQGGNTGLAAGATPLDLERAIVLSLARMRRVRALDAAGFTMNVDAGCVLADVQSAAHDAGRFFPLSLAAEGSAQIGGLIATNAGGTAVLRYGSMRALVLGLEVVLADGSIADGMRALRKDNAGYDWKQLFIGSEGTLGVITGAVLRLFARPAHRATALLGIATIQDAIAAFGDVQEALGEALTGCELFSERAVALRLGSSRARSPSIRGICWSKQRLAYRACAAASRPRSASQANADTLLTAWSPRAARRQPPYGPGARRLPKTNGAPAAAPNMMSPLRSRRSRPFSTKQLPPLSACIPAHMCSPSAMPATATSTSTCSSVTLRRKM
jgi:FAD/FMN-containing dehydrogenase